MPTSTDLPRQHLCTQELDIDAPASAVWEVLADFNNAYLWAPSVSHSYGLTDAERCVGAARRCTVEGFGTIDEHITEWTEGRGFTFTVTPVGPFAGSHSRWRIQSRGPGRSRVSIELGYDVRFGFMGGLMNALVLKDKLETNLAGVLQSLKTRVETGAEIRPRVAAQRSAG